MTTSQGPRETRRPATLLDDDVEDFMSVYDSDSANLNRRPRPMDSDDYGDPGEALFDDPEADAEDYGDV